jgi:UDP-2-acetamido-2,6-beta-L-arabino-hexul-4-ose reductase
LRVVIRELSLFRDERGWLAEILTSADNSEKIKQIHFALSKPGAVRGNHYHKNRTEWLCVTSGTGRILLEDSCTHERKELIVTGDSPVLVKIFPGVIHAIENCADVPMHLLVLADRKPNTNNPDIYARKLLPQTNAS